MNRLPKKFMSEGLDPSFVAIEAYFLAFKLSGLDIESRIPQEITEVVTDYINTKYNTESTQIQILSHGYTRESRYTSGEEGWVDFLTDPSKGKDHKTTALVARKAREQAMKLVEAGILLPLELR